MRCGITWSNWDSAKWLIPNSICDRTMRLLVEVGSHFCFMAIMGSASILWLTEFMVLFRYCSWFVITHIGPCISLMIIIVTFIVSMCICVFSLSTGANCKPKVTVHVQGGGMLPVALLVHLLGTNTHCCSWNVGALLGKYSKTHGCWILREGCGIRQAAGLWTACYGCVPKRVNWLCTCTGYSSKRHSATMSAHCYCI